MKKQVLPYFGSASLNRITNAVVREWVSTLLSTGLSAATTRKAVSLCGNAWLLQLRTNAFSSIRHARCPFLLSARAAALSVAKRS
jgi:hypothetical protein